MELTAGRSETLKGSAIGIGACCLSLAAGSWMHAVTGSAGILLVLLLATAAAAWYAGRWVGLMTTVAGAIVACYLLPPSNTMQIAAPQDSAALYSFAIGGVIVSLLCGAAWQLRMEARAVEATQTELARLRALNGDLLWRAERENAVSRASEGLLQALARAALEHRSDFVEIASHLAGNSKVSFAPVDCGAVAQAASRRHGYAVHATALPTVWADEYELHQLFEMLISRAVRNESVAGLDLGSGRLPESWLLSAKFRRAGSSAPAISPLTPLERSMCERIIVRQGGRCWSSSTPSGDWELRFVLPRDAAPAARPA